MRKGNHFLIPFLLLFLCAFANAQRTTSVLDVRNDFDSLPPVTLQPVRHGYDIPTAPRLIDCVIIHSSYNPVRNDTFNTQSILRLWQRYRVSPHYFITRDARILSLVPESHIAHHAGRGTIPDTGEGHLNRRSIGIEVASTPTQGPTPEQYDALIRLVRHLQRRYPVIHILRHSDIAPRRKTDPWGFDWDWFLLQLE